LPPLQRGNPGPPPPLRRAAEPFVERLVVGTPRSFEENMRKGKGKAGRLMEAVEINRVGDVGTV
jgi:hypothetical protein